MNQSNYLIGLGLLITAPVIWGGMFPVAELILPSVDGITTTAIRYGLGALMLLVILAFLEGNNALKLEENTLKLWLYGTIGFAGFNILAFVGLGFSQPEHAAIIMAMMPMITVLITWLKSGKRPAGFTLMTVAIAFSGVFLVVTNGNPAKALQNGEASGDLMLLTGALCWVIYTLGASQFPSWSALRYTTLSCALGTLSILAITLALIPVGITQIPSINVVSNLGWEFAYLIILGAVIAVLSWNAGIKAVGPVNGVLFINLVPITAFTVGVLQGHSFTHYEVIGALLVISALIANNLFIRRQLSVSKA
ncbi:DMT family transporter [Hydrogenovibrio sp. JE_KL2]|uniref:DMT family transporter n=1 Tax=Hydrogenovibrio sp. JE_KL2 TaxID=2651188 RepID=UPI00128D020B|nr:DMT family transporter [Hydrogenovibrio sp. JE_KL2]MPQ76728.1 DMT family transporter [Hydrogenovibrio sp. JE_KL2]